MMRVPLTNLSNDEGSLESLTNLSNDEGSLEDEHEVRGLLALHYPHLDGLPTMPVI